MNWQTSLQSHAPGATLDTFLGEDITPDVGGGGGQQTGDLDALVCDTDFP